MFSTAVSIWLTENQIAAGGSPTYQNLVDEDGLTTLVDEDGATVLTDQTLTT